MVLLRHNLERAKKLKFIKEFIKILIVYRKYSLWLMKFGNKYPNEIKHLRKPANVLEIRDFLSLCEIILQAGISINLLKDLNDLYVAYIKRSRLYQLQN